MKPAVRQLLMGSRYAPYTGQVASHCFQPTTLNTTNKQQMCRTYHIAGTALSSFQVMFPNWYGSESAPGGIATITASIEYPAGTFTQIKFSGVASGSIPDGATLLSDAVNVNIPEGAGFYVRCYYTNAIGIIYATFINWTSSGLGEAHNFGVSGIVDQTMGGTITQTESRCYGPIAILATTRKPSVLVLGDSRGAGQGQLSSTTSETGQITPSLLGKVPFINLSMPGEKAQLVVATNALRKALAPYVTHIVCELGINDINASLRTAAQTLADVQTLKTTFGVSKFYAVTLPPVSTSTDSFATVVNQTTAASNTERVSYNNLIRAGQTGFTGFFECADPVESARDSGKWNAPGYTSDGLHALTVGYDAIKNSGAIHPAAFR